MCGVEPYPGFESLTLRQSSHTKEPRQVVPPGLLFVREMVRRLYFALIVMLEDAAPAFSTPPAYRARTLRVPFVGFQL